MTLTPSLNEHNQAMSALPFLIRPTLSAVGRGRLTILIYHRVHAVADTLFPNELDADRFDEQMSWVGALLNVVPLSEAIDMLRHDRLPNRAVSITFDDGYRDNLEVALPILRRHGFSATIFVATGYLDGGRMWNDTVIEAIRRAPGSGVDLGNLGLGRRGLATPVERRAAIRDALMQLKYLSPETRLDQANSLARQVGEDLPEDIMLRSEQVRELHIAGMGIGAHTVSHPILTRLDDEKARFEIREGKRTLESILGVPVSLFAYPNGKPQADYGEEHVKIVRELGFSAAVSTRPGAAEEVADRYQLPRYSPWGRSLVRFGANLCRNYVIKG